MDNGVNSDPDLICSHGRYLGFHRATILTKKVPEHTHTQTKMDISTLVPLPVRLSPEFCKRDADGQRSGEGVAVCQDMLVISSCNRLQVFVLPEDIVRGDLGSPRELTHVRTLGGVAPMEFQFYYPCSGFMAFADGCDEATTTLLLVASGGKDGRGTVHVIDVAHGTHVGYVAAPGTIMNPRAVATRKSLAAVSCAKAGTHEPLVLVFRSSGSSCGVHTWTAVHAIAMRAIATYWIAGLGFTADGLRLMTVDHRAERVSIFGVEDGSLLRHITLQPNSGIVPLHVDVEECVMDGGRTGVVICHLRGLVIVADEADEHTGAVVQRRDLGFNCNALAWVPGLGLVVRHNTGVQFLATPDAVAMAAMSSCKVAWMVAVCRGMVALARWPRDDRASAALTKKHRFS